MNARKRNEEEQRQLEVLAQYRGLVLKLAWMYWRTLPASVKLWVDIEDLIEEAYLYVIRHEFSRDFDPLRGKKSTFLWTGIKSILLNFALAHQTQKRFGYRADLEEVDWTGGQEDKGFRTVEAREAFSVVYEAASPLLQAHMRAWFGPRRPKVRWSKEARRSYREFRVLAYQHRLTPDDCRHLMQVGVWGW